MLNIKRLIDLARLETGSYKEVAKRLDTSGVRITHWKNGRNEPTPFEIFRMAEIARLEPEKAFYEVMTEVDKDNAEYWCARLESNQRPSASITVIGQDHRVMGNIVSETVSNALIKLHEENGIQFVFDATVNEITEVKRVVNQSENEEENQTFSQVGGVTLANGEQVDADIVILGTGVAPRTELFEGVNATDGVQVDEHLQLREGVYALGDIAKASGQMGRMRIEHWRVALQHGLVTAAAILNDDSVNSLAARIPFFWTMQYGKSLRYSGHAATPDNNILFGSPDTLDYIEYYFDDDGEDARASAASTLGRDKELVAFSELLRRGHAPTRAQLKAGFNIIDQAQALSP